jgi:hypothetical protein
MREKKVHGALKVAGNFSNVRDEAGEVSIQKVNLL